MPFRVSGKNIDVGDAKPLVLDGPGLIEQHRLHGGTQYRSRPRSVVRGM